MTPAEVLLDTACSKEKSQTKLLFESDNETEDENEDAEESSQIFLKSSTDTSSMDNVDKVVIKVVKNKTYQHLIPKEESELVSYIRSNLFRRLKIVNERFTESTVLQCFEHLRIMDNKERSRKFRNVLDFLNSTINARRNYLKHQIVRVMQGK